MHMLIVLYVENYSPKYVTNGFLNGKPYLDESCEHIILGTKWYKFGILLELNNTKLDSID